MVLVGIILVLVGNKYVKNVVVQNLLQFTGITIIGIFFISLIYEALVAEKHFKAVIGLLRSELTKMDSIQSKCLKLGIRDIFETMSDFRAKFPFMRVVAESPKNGEIVCVAKSLFNLLNKTDEMKRGLKEGLSFKFVCSNPSTIHPITKELCSLYSTDIESALEALRNLLAWAIKNKAKGSIELRYNSIEMPNSAMIFRSRNDDKELLAWDLTFGRDDIDKKILVLEVGDHLLGLDLKTRFIKVLNNSILQIKYVNGRVRVNKLRWSFDRIQDNEDKKEKEKAADFELEC